jgi:hypothetical protein
VTALLALALTLVISRRITARRRRTHRPRALLLSNHAGSGSPYCRWARAVPLADKGAR